MRDRLIKTCLTLVPHSISRKLTGDFVPVFMMHRIIDCNGDLDQVQVNQLHSYLEYIRKHNYNPIALEDLFLSIAEGKPLPGKSVAFTVDDGFADQFEHLAPIFSQYDIPLTCFVITGMLDGILWPWDDQIKHIVTTTKRKLFSVNLPDGDQLLCKLDQERNEVLTECIRSRLKTQDQTYLYEWLHNLYEMAEVDVPVQVPPLYRSASWEQADQFVRNGHSIAAHTRTHRILSRLNDTEAREEILGSYQNLKTRIPESADIFAYPTGRPIDFGEREEKIILNSPIIGAVSTVPDSIRKGYRLEAIPRYGLPKGMGDFLQYLSFIEVLKNKIRKIEPVN